jgi:hypothetical protein
MDWIKPRQKYMDEEFPRKSFTVWRYPVVSLAAFLEEYTFTTKQENLYFCGFCGSVRFYTVWHGSSG